ncbi:MAG: D-alanyl-D-alanine carboxypeptidase, partial [Hyphomicrobiaceae bacterium]|nr:D-alanyl-D-alanine carboxypeptidase [Hyphomicrobiaceae bacterium]
MALTLAASAVAVAAPKSLVVVDANTGAVLIDQDGSEPRSPASLTKMMTLYMAFEALERGSVTMRTPIRISTRAENAAPSKLDLDAGDTIALEDAIKALITKSANDVAIALAEHFSGSEEAFARSMTAKARELGMAATTFKNASGLPDSGQMTTARDMVTLSLRLYDTFPRYFALFSTRSFAYGGKTYKNHNTLMIHMPGVNGIKTGYTNASGFNLVTSYEAEGRHLIAAIFGGDSAASRNAAMRVALTRTISKASTAKTRRPLVVASSRAKPPVAVPAPQPAVRAASPPPPQVAAARTVPQPIAVARPAPLAIVPTADVPTARSVAT